MLLGLAPTSGMMRRAGGIPVGATGNDADCVLLLHGSGPNNSTVFTDYSYSRHGDAAVVGDSKVSTLVSKFGNGAMYFDGAGDSINYPVSADWNLGTGNFTLECWFNRQGGFGATQSLFGQSAANDTSRAFEIDFAGDNRLWAYVWIAGALAVQIPSLAAISTAGWHHVALVRASSIFYLFIDGVSQGTASNAGAVDVSGSKLSIGKLGESTASYNFNGYMNELRFSKIARWTGPFTPPAQPYGPDPDFFTKLLLHMNGVTGTTQFIDASMYLKGYATVVGDAKLSTAQVMMGSASGIFDGVGDYITYPNSTDWDFGSGDFTVDFWVRPNAFAATWNALVARNGPAGLNDRWWIAINGAGGFITFDCYQMPGPTNVFNLPFTTALTTGIWQHVAVVRSGNTITGYINGTAAGSIAFSGAMPTFASGALFIAAGDSVPNFCTNCFIDELRISKGVARWTANFSVPAVPYLPPDPVITSGNDIYTKLLMHFDATLLDSSLAAHGTGTNAGASGISATQVKFGAAAYANSQNGYFTFPHSADWEFGAGDFTIDWWEYRTAAGAVIARDLNTTYCPFIIVNHGTGNVVYMTSTGSSWDMASAVAINANPGNVWFHQAVVRQGSTFKAYVNGVQSATWSSAAAIIANANPLCIGAVQGGQNMGGYIDELRISKGIARWTANFTPPVAAYF